MYGPDRKSKYSTIRLVTSNNSLCNRTRIRRLNHAFIMGEDAPAHSIRAAVDICRQCPIRRECAADALTSGSSLDGSVIAPATAVVQAGVVCRGDQTTARLLAEIAGIPVPAYRQKIPRTRAPEHCVSCGRKMVPWTRYDVPDGYVMHHARGFCTECRSAYKRASQASPRKERGLRKEVDRKRHHDYGGRGRGSVASVA